MMAGRSFPTRYRTMQMEPVILRLGPLEISGFGLLMLAGFLAATWVIRRELLRRGLRGDYATEIFITSVIGGLLGAKLWYATLYGDPAALLERSGMVWWGGLLGGALLVLLNGRRRQIPMRFTLEIAAASLALAYAIGRLGCFLVGDDYGLPTSRPWGVEFPRGLPPSTGHHLDTLFGVDLPPGTRPSDVLAVHPTQLYESAAMLVAFWLLLRLRDHRHGTGWLFGVYLTLAGVERFLVEFVRAKDDRFFAGLTLAQLTAVAAVALGCLLMWRWRRSAPTVDQAAARALGGVPPHAPGGRR
jgi:phosphatidylglycerol:prolipoprotein diacylglycerol transferase